MTPEEKARQETDHQLQQCGWIVQDRHDMNISAGLGIAIREFPLLPGEAEYLLYVDGKATGVERLSAKYVSALPPGVSA